MDIIIDTREQLPLFKNGCIRYKLPVGDYSTMMLKDVFAVERKSPSDLYGTIIQGHRRFRDELLRAEDMGIKLVMYVECSKDDFIAKRFPGGRYRQTSGQTLGKIIKTIEERYGVEVVWCSSRRACSIAVKKRLIEEEAKL